MGNIVITSKESYPFHEAVKSVSSDVHIRERANFVIWEFTRVDEAIRCARLFMSLGFEYVQREA